MHILFVEDEAKIANFVRSGLKEQGFVVDYCDREKMGCPSSKTCAGKDKMCQ